MSDSPHADGASLHVEQDADVTVQLVAKMLEFFFLEHAEELRIIALRRRNKHTTHAHRAHKTTTTYITKAPALNETSDLNPT